jgi:hypothetical protein
MAVGYNPSIVSDGLVMYLDAANSRSYPGSGITVNSLTGGYNGTLVNGVGFSSSNNGSFFFDGTNDYIIFSNSDVMGSVYTQNIWFKKSNSGLHLLADTGYAGAIVYSSKVEFYYTSSSPFLLSINYNFLINRWYMISLVRGSTIKSVYLDGSLIGSVSSSDSYDTSGTNLYVGSNGGNSEFLNGNLGQVQIYNRALTQQEILQNFNATRFRYGI